MTQRDRYRSVTSPRPRPRRRSADHGPACASASLRGQRRRTPAPPGATGREPATGRPLPAATGSTCRTGYLLTTLSAS